MAITSLEEFIENYQLEDGVPGSPEDIFAGSLKLKEEQLEGGPVPSNLSVNTLVANGDSTGNAIEGYGTSEMSGVLGSSNNNITYGGVFVNTDTDGIALKIEEGAVLIHGDMTHDSSFTAQFDSDVNFNGDVDFTNAVIIGLDLPNGDFISDNSAQSTANINITSATANTAEFTQTDIYNAIKVNGNSHFIGVETINGSIMVNGDSSNESGTFINDSGAKTALYAESSNDSYTFVATTKSGSGTTALITNEGTGNALVVTGDSIYAGNSTFGTGFITDFNGTVNFEDATVLGLGGSGIPYTTNTGNDPAGSDTPYYVEADSSQGQTIYVKNTNTDQYSHGLKGETSASSTGSAGVVGVAPTKTGFGFWTESSSNVGGNLFVSETLNGNNASFTSTNASLNAVYATSTTMSGVVGETSEASAYGGVFSNTNGGAGLRVNAGSFQCAGISTFDDTLNISKNISINVNNSTDISLEVINTASSGTGGHFKCENGAYPLVVTSSSTTDALYITNDGGGNALTTDGNAVIGGTLSATTLYGSGGAVTVSTSNFNNNLSSSDNNIQKALDTIDNIPIGGGIPYTTNTGNDPAGSDTPYYVEADSSQGQTIYVKNTNTDQYSHGLKGETSASSTGSAGVVGVAPSGGFGFWTEQQARVGQTMFCAGGISVSGTVEGISYDDVGAAASSHSHAGSYVPLIGSESAGKYTVETSGYQDNLLFVKNTNTSEWSNGIKGEAKGGTNTNGVVGAAGSGGWDFYADGSGGNYGPFTGAHDMLITKDYEYSVGDIFIVDEFVSCSDGISQVIFKGITSSTEKSKDVFGVANCSIKKLKTEDAELIYSNVAGITEDVDVSIYDMTAVNSVGEGMMNVCDANGNIESGDYICSSNIKGKGQKQDSEMMMNYTVAKSLMTIDWSQETDGVDGCFIQDGAKCKMVPCTYHCG